jgi:hypothetical protein
MSEDDIVAQIGKHEREARKDDARFDRVARGEADAAELAELERAAADDPELAARLEGSRPLDPAVVDRIAASVPKPAKPAPKVVVGPWRRRLTLAAGPLALAAAMLVYVTAQRGPSLPELPAYSVTALGEQTMRGPAEASARLHVAKTPERNARFEIVLRPATAPAGKVVAYAFTLASSDAEPAPLEAKVEVAPEGAVRLTGPSRALLGAKEIRVVVGDLAAIGKFDDAATRAAANRSDAHVRVLVVPVDRD